MSIISINELQKLVVSLNETFQSTVYKEMKEEINFLPFEIRAGQTYGDPIVEFVGVYIWGGEDDNRKWIEEKDDYEDLHDYLITEACKILKQLNTGMIPLTLHTSDTDEDLDKLYKEWLGKKK